MRALLPPHVLAALEADPTGRAWLDKPSGSRFDEMVALKWRTDLPDEVRGWVIGLSLFDQAKWSNNVGNDERLTHAVPAVLDAFVAGALAGLHAPRAWLVFERILLDAKRPLPAGSDKLVALGLRSKRAHDRAVAERLAPLVGIAIERESPAPPADEPIDLLRRLVAAWGATHDAALEEPIARIGQQIAHGRGPIDARSRHELEQAWQLIAERRDPGDVDRLLDTTWPGPWKTATLRANALAKFPPDPRIATKLATVAQRYTSHAASAFHTVVRNVLVAMPTPAVLAVLERLPHHYLYAQARTAIEARVVHAADAALLAEARASSSVRDVSALWAQHAANPGDAGLRAVLADALIASGDPRGEFIILQTRVADGSADAATRSRMNALYAHTDAWVARLPGVVRAWFSRGFVTRLECNASTQDIKATLDRPEWATIEDLTMTHVADLVELVPRMPLLRSLCTPLAESLARLEAAGTYPSIRALGAADWMPADRRAFPNLAVLAGRFSRASATRLREIADTACALEVHAIVHVGAPRDQLADIIATRAGGPPELRLLIDTNATSFHSYGWRARILRDLPRAELTLHPHYRVHCDELLAALAAAGITEVVTVDDIDLAG